MKAKFLFVAGALLGVAAIQIPIDAEAAEIKANTVQDLYRMCKSSNYVEELFCLGVIAGSAGQLQYVAAVAEHLKDPQDRVLVLAIAACPDNATNGAMFQAFINWAEKHPEKWSDEMQDGVNRALHETWPCR